MEYDFEIENREVVAKERNTGVVAWRGRPKGSRAERLLDYTASDLRRAFPNVIRLRSDVTIAWHAELPEPSSADSYTDIARDGLGLRGYSCSGYSVILDTGTGRKFIKSFPARYSWGSRTMLLASRPVSD